jgi:hypothetical protein
MARNETREPLGMGARCETFDGVKSPSNSVRSKLQLCEIVPSDNEKLLTPLVRCYMPTGNPGAAAASTPYTCICRRESFPQGRDQKAVRASRAEPSQMAWFECVAK